EPAAAEPVRVAAQHTELDLPVAEHVRVRRAAAAALVEEVREDALAILAREAHAMQRQAERGAYAARVLEIPRGVAVAVVVLPVRHVEAFDGVALVAQEQRGDGGVDAARKRNDDGLCRHGAYCPAK